jgi:RNA-directed DNA polymerase
MIRSRLIAARCLADAFLAGTWTRGDLVERGRAAVGRTRWLRGVVSAVLDAYPEAPLTRRDALARVIAEDRRFRPRPLNWPLEPTAMIPRFGVPEVATVGELAAFLAVDVSRLDWLADRRNLLRDADERLRHYRCAWVPKRTAGWRLLQAPKPALKAAQRRVLDGILGTVPPHDAAHGFRVGRSPLTAMAPHVGRRVVVRVDLEEFFPSVQRSRVRALFRALGYPEGVAGVLAALCTAVVAADVLAAAPEPASMRLRGAHLPQGAPTSSMIANLCAWGLDVRLAAAAASVGAVYTRYADDLVFSGDEAFEWRTGSFLPLVGAIAREEGFRVNWGKTRHMRRSQRQESLGIVVNERMTVRRQEWKRLEAILVNCGKTSPAAQNRDGHADFEAHLRGRVAWVAAVDPRHGAELLAKLAAIDWSR